MHIYTGCLARESQGDDFRPRKLIIQIPCLNEAATLPIALAALPRQVEGFDIVEWLVIDDGSTDDTVEVASKAGVDHIVSHPCNRGLAAAFMTGIEAAIAAGADVIVNTDADNQYHADDIPLLTGPILRHEADMVVGARPIADTEHFSLLKKKLQALGSWAVRMASRTAIADAPSGFRAITREAALRLNIFGNYTYTLETLIQAGLSELRVISVPVRTNPDLRPSRLVRGIWNYVFRSLGTILRVFIIYRPFVLFAGAGAICLAIGLGLGVRFLFFLSTGDGQGHIQSVVLSALLLILGALVFMMALIADLIAVNRKLSEQILVRVRRLEQFGVTTDTSQAAEIDSDAVR
ncbi:glycosyltransferase family 2 protein [Luteibacter sp. SG786]|uniref:glycosyltransferase family 2 protein n=1 Tax=Luteibacter sp. SG786 TaxID=2587130 RepID=UPI00141FD655|nr:glycosyltransferase family 2 protein [Luteibacter sp. SG786]NII56430.1 glycosyltransferase involved in cell wall biosynthesis [Luteibacter sp. SG786]